MALIPKLDICIGNKCNTVTITEETGVYNVATNVGGWGAPNIDTSVVTNATIDIYDYTGVTLLQSFVVKDTNVPIDNYPNPIVGEFTLFEDITWNQPDGIYEIIYTVIDNVGPDTYTNEKQYQMFTCGARNCIDTLVAKMITECDSKKIETMKSQINEMENLLYGAKCAFSCGAFSKAADIITILNKMCSIISDCTGSCGSC